MYLKEILETILPTRWSQYIMGMSIVASGFVYILPMFWPLSMLAMTNDARQIFQVLLSVSTLLLGTLICLTLVIVAFHKQRKTIESDLKENQQELEAKFKTKYNQEIKTLKEKIKELEDHISKSSSDNAMQWRNHDPKNERVV